MLRMRNDSTAINDSKRQRPYIVTRKLAEYYTLCACVAKNLPTNGLREFTVAKMTPV